MTTPIIARFQFKPSRANEFIDTLRVDGKEIQPTVSELQVDQVEEVMDYVRQFDDALIDCNAIVNGQVINLSDFTESAE